MIYYAEIDEIKVIKRVQSNLETGLIRLESELGIFELLGSKLNDDGTVELKKNVPAFVTMRQARRAMLDAGIYEAADSAIKAMGGKALIDWEYSSTLERNNPLIDRICVELGLTDEQIDDLFIVASKESLP